MKAGISKFVWFWMPLAAYAGAIFFVSSMSAPPLPPISFQYFDKVLHATEYFIFGFILFRALAMGQEGLRPNSALFWTVLLGAIYGASDEIHQYFVPGRSADINDFVVDVLGTFAGGIVYWKVIMRFSQARIGLKSPSVLEKP
jgi:VanZ family protein